MSSRAQAAALNFAPRRTEIFFRPQQRFNPALTGRQNDGHEASTFFFSLIFFFANIYKKWVYNLFPFLPCTSAPSRMNSFTGVSITENSWRTSSKSLELLWHAFICFCFFLKASHAICCWPLPVQNIRFLWSSPEASLNTIVKGKLRQFFLFSPSNKPLVWWFPRHVIGIPQT